MEKDVEIAPFVGYKNCVSRFWVCIFGKFNKSREKSLYPVVFDEKGRILI